MPVLINLTTTAPVQKYRSFPIYSAFDGHIQYTRESRDIRHHVIQKKGVS